MKRDISRRIMALPLRQKVAFAWRLMRDDAVPLAAKAVLPGVMLYLASPIDIVPDFIPLLGQLDDVLVLGAALAFVLWLTPRHVLEDLLREYE